MGEAERGFFGEALVEEEEYGGGGGAKREEAVTSFSKVPSGGGGREFFLPKKVYDLKRAQDLGPESGEMDRPYFISNKMEMLF